MSVFPPAMPDEGPDYDQLVQIGQSWSRSNVSERDMPSRRNAFELAREGLGRPPSIAEQIVLQRAARDAKRVTQQTNGDSP